MEGKAAILFSGSAYNIRHSLESINKNLVEENDADVFIVTTRRCKRRKTPKSEIFDCDVDWENYRKKNDKTILDMSPLTEEEIQLIRDTFGDRLKVFEIAEENESYWNTVLQAREKMLNTVNTYIDTHPKCFNGIKIDSPDKGTILYTSDQYQHVKRCYELFDNYSKQNNIKYDYVMRARIDFICPFSFNMEHYLLNHDQQYLYVCGSVNRDPFAWADEFCWFSRRNMASKLFPHLDKIGNLTTSSKTTIDGSNNDTIFSPECQFAILLDQLKLPIYNVKIYRSAEYNPGKEGDNWDYFNYRFRRDFPISIEYEYDRVCNLPTDINEHCPVLYEYALKCKHVTELGQRYSNSTIALLKAAMDTNGKFISYDPQGNSRIDYVKMVAKENNIDYEFKLSTAMNHEETESLIEETEMLFIDTNHHDIQVGLETTLHSPKVRKYLAYHDMGRNGATCFWNKGQGYESGHGMKLFMEPFLENNKHIWKIVEWRDNNNGLLILERIGY